MAENALPPPLKKTHNQGAFYRSNIIKVKKSFLNVFTLHFAGTKSSKAESAGGSKKSVEENQPDVPAAAKENVCPEPPAAAAAAAAANETDV